MGHSSGIHSCLHGSGRSFVVIGSEATLDSDVAYLSQQHSIADHLKPRHFTPRRGSDDYT